jgi:hypothetical protein
MAARPITRVWAQLLVSGTRIAPFFLIEPGALQPHASNQSSQAFHESKARELDGAGGRKFGRMVEASAAKINDASVEDGDRRLKCYSAV